MYWVPSAVFTSVTGLFTFSVRVGWPDRVRAARDRDLRRGRRHGVELEDRVRRREVGAGGHRLLGPVHREHDCRRRRRGRRRRRLRGGRRRPAGPAGRAGRSGRAGRRRAGGRRARPSNGSLLEKRENDWSWPGSAGGVTTATSVDESVGAAVVVVGARRRASARRPSSGPGSSRPGSSRPDAADRLRAPAAVHPHHRVDGVRHGQHEHDGEDDDQLLLLRLLRLGRVGDLFLSHYLLLSCRLGLRRDVGRRRRGRGVSVPVLVVSVDVGVVAGVVAAALASAAP